MRNDYRPREWSLSLRSSTPSSRRALVGRRWSRVTRARSFLGQYGLLILAGTLGATAFFISKDFTRALNRRP